MTLADFWTIILVVILSICVHSVRLISNDKAKSSVGDQDENYIITHYGREYYTPVRTSEIQVHKDGYFTAEVIPVNVNTGEELKTVQNLFVPMHTGYSIAVDGGGGGGDDGGSNRKLKPGVVLNERLIGEPSRNIDYKSKIPKKFKTNYAFNAKKSNEEHAAEPQYAAAQPNPTAKSVPKRHVQTNSAEFDRRYRYFNFLGSHINGNRRMIIT